MNKILFKRNNFNLKNDHLFKILLGTELIKTNLDFNFGKSNKEILIPNSEI